MAISPIATFRKTPTRSNRIARLPIATIFKSIMSGRPRKVKKVMTLPINVIFGHLQVCFLFHVFVLCCFLMLWLYCSVANILYLPYLSFVYLYSIAYITHCSIYSIYYRIISVHILCILINTHLMHKHITIPTHLNMTLLHHIYTNTIKLLTEKAKGQNLTI